MAIDYRWSVSLNLYDEISYNKRNIIGYDEREPVYLTDFINADKNPILGNVITSYAVGKTAEGKYLTADLAEQGNIVVAGGVGSGKNTFLNSFITSIICRFKPVEARIMIIGEVSETTNWMNYQGIPHLLLPVIDNSELTLAALRMLLNWVMCDRRVLLNGTFDHNSIIKRFDYDIFSPSIDSISEYNSLIRNKFDEDHKLPYIYVIISDFDKLVSEQNYKEITIILQQLLKLSKAYGIHFVIGTERPSHEIYTFCMDNDISTKISFKVEDKLNSIAVLGTQGAEDLLGKGDMLYLSGTTDMLYRVQAPYVSSSAISAIVQTISYMKEKHEI